MKTCLALAMLAIALVASGCEEPRKEPAVAACDRKGCPQRCSDLAGSDCNVLQKSCQERLFEAVSCVRGGGGDLPEIRTLTEDEVRAEQAADEDAGVDAGGTGSGAGEGDADGGAGDGDAGEGDDGSEDAPEEVISLLENWDTALRLLGLRAPKSEEETVDFLGGYYEPDERRITLIDRGKAQNDARSQRLLAHELVHALQDQHMGFSDLRRATGNSYDAVLALGCLTEGDAELHMELAWSLLQGLPIDEDYWDATLEWRLKYNRDSVLNSESPYDQAWLLRYPVGARYLFDLWRSEGSWAVEALYERPPLATIFWMNGLAANRARTEPLTANLACAVAELPKGYERRASDTLGAFNVFAFLGRQLKKKGVPQTEKSWQRALGWRQDHFEVFSGPKGETALSWRIRFANKALAEEIAQELDEAGQAQRVARRGEEIEIFTSDSPAALKNFRPTRSEACPAIED